MTTNNYDAATSLAIYAPSRTSNAQARIWSREKVLHDWTDLGAAEFFEGAGSDPTGLSGYATNKLWLNTDAGVTTAVGTVRYFRGGDPTSLSNWPALDRAAFAAHLGAHGGSFDYTWSTSTSGDPGTGKVLGNNATLASVTELNISKTGRQGQAYGPRILTWDDATTLTNRGRLSFYSVTTAGAYAEFRITGALTDNTTYYTVPVAVVSAGTLSNNLLVGVDFVRSGDKGQDGAASLDAAIKETYAEAAASLYASTLDVVITLGYLAPGDGGGGHYKRVASEPTHQGKFQTSDAVWWELVAHEGNPKQFGAVGDGTADDTAEIQAAIDYALIKKRSDVYLPAGTYKISDVLHLGYGVSGTDTINLYGTGGMAPYTQGFSGATIVPTFRDRPCISIQGARGSTVRGIGFEGGMYTSIADRVAGAGVESIPTTASALLDTAISPTGLDRYRPYCAIAIDPYAGTAPGAAYPTATYPAWLGGGIPQYGKNYSSAPAVENCKVRGFPVGVVCQPCDADGNGDFLRVRDCEFDAVIYPVSIGNSQSRNVEVSNNRIARFHTFLTTNVFGKQLGKVDGIVKNNSFTTGYQWFEITNPVYAGRLKFEGGYSEAVVRLGLWGTAGASSTPHLEFDGCTFHSSAGTIAGGGCGIIERELIESIGNVVIHINGCNLRTSAGVQITGNAQAMVTLNAPTIEAGGSPGTMSAAKQLAYNYFGGVVGPHHAHRGNLQLIGGMEGVYFSGGGFTQTAQRITDTVNGAGTYKYDGTADRILTPGSMLYKDNGPEPGPLYRIIGGWPPAVVPKSSAFTGYSQSGLVLSTSYSATFQTNTRNETRIAAGDILWDSDTRIPFVVLTIALNGGTGRYDITAEQLTGWKLVATVATSLVTVGSTGNFWIFKTGIRLPNFTYWGDFSSGSATVDNVHGGDGNAGAVPASFPSGTLLFGPTRKDAQTGLPFSNLNYITGSASSGGSTAGGTATLALNANQTGRFQFMPVLLG